jgi:hypothetical protein
MSTTLTTSLNLQLSGVFTDEVGTSTIGPQLRAVLQNGVLINQCDLVHSKRYLISTGTPRVLNLADGSLLTPNNNPAAFVKICFALAWNRADPANTTQLLSWGGGSNPLAWLANALLIGGPGACDLKHDPSLAALAVTPATAMNLQLTLAAGAAVPIDVFLAGRSA